MLKAGITGGIGAGKTIVCRLFELLGIPVFYADEAAQKLMNDDTALVKGIKALFGEQIYRSGILDRRQLGRIVFDEPQKLTQLNALVHPASVAYARKWMDGQHAPYVLKEAAIFFESGSDKDMDFMIGIDAPEELRIRRVMQRSHLLREEIMQRMARQMDQTEKMKRCDYVICNDDQAALVPQVLHVHELLLKKAASIIPHS